MIIVNILIIKIVSKLFRAYGLYNERSSFLRWLYPEQFQSSFELTGYITTATYTDGLEIHYVSKLFRAYGLYNMMMKDVVHTSVIVSKLFRAYGLYNL